MSHTPRILGLALLGFSLAASAQAAVLSAKADRQADGQVMISWTTDPGETVDVLLAPAPTTPLAAMQVVSSADPDGQHLLARSESTPYVTLRSSDGRVYRLAERLPGVVGASNFRDVGGYRTADGRQIRWGMIYRSSSLSELTPGDAERLRALGLRTIVDLRSSDERKDEPTRWSGSARPQTVAHDYEMDVSAFLGSFRNGATPDAARKLMTDFYPAVLQSHRPQFRAVFDSLLAREDGPVLFHCTAGKDRTGVLTALLLSALGVPRDQVIADFLLSNTYYQPKPLPGDAGGLARLPPDVMAVLMGVEASYLEAVFAELDRTYGGVEGYLDRELGVDATDLAILKARYTY
jgi:protein-tyrosine phosphatase